MKKPSEKFMYDAVTPPNGPRTRMPSASSSAWYFHVSGAGSHDQRGAASGGRAWVLIGLSFADASGSPPCYHPILCRDEPPRKQRHRLLLGILGPGREREA